MFEINGSAVFTDPDMGIGMCLVDTLKNEGFVVSTRYQDLFDEKDLTKKKSMVINFSSKRNGIFLIKEET